MLDLPVAGEKPWDVKLNNALNDLDTRLENTIGVPDGGTTGQALVKLSDDDYDAGWGDVDLATSAGSANNPHSTQSATRNASLPKNFWQYTGTAGVDDPDNWISGDEWISV